MISAPRVAAEIENDFVKTVSASTLKKVLSKPDYHRRTAHRKPRIKKLV